MEQSQPSVEKFRDLYDVQPTDSRAFEVVRQRLVSVYNDYRRHLVMIADIMDKAAGDDYSYYQWLFYKVLFPNWPRDVIIMRNIELLRLEQLVAVAKPFFPERDLEFFRKEATGNLAHPAFSYQLAERKDLTPEQRFLLTGKIE